MSDSPLIRLHPERQRPGRQDGAGPGPGIGRIRPARPRPGAGRPQDRRAAHRRRRGGAQVQRGDRRGRARHRAGRPCAHAQPGAGGLRARSGVRPGRACRSTTCPNRERARFMGFVREDGRVGTRNFIGILSSVNCSATVIQQHRRPFHARAAGRLSQCRRRGRVRPDQRLRHVVAQRAFRRAAPHPGRLCPPCQPGGRADRGTGLRAQPGGFTGRVARARDRPADAHAGDAGGGRHPRDHPGRHRGGGSHAAAGQRLPTPERVAPATSRSGWSAAARTAFPASPPTRRWARRWTSWCAMAAPPSCRRRRRSTASSTC